MNEDKRNLCAAIYLLERAVGLLKKEVEFEETGYNDGKGWVSTSGRMMPEKALAERDIQEALSMLHPPTAHEKAMNENPVVLP